MAEAEMRAALEAMVSAARIIQHGEGPNMHDCTVAVDGYPCSLCRAYLFARAALSAPPEPTAHDQLLGRPCPACAADRT